MANYTLSSDTLQVTHLRATDVLVGNKSLIDSEWVGNIVKASVGTGTGDIGALTTSVATNTTNIATNTTDIATLNTTVSGHTTSIATNTTNIATNTSGLSTLNTTVTNLSTTVSGHTASIATNTADIDAVEANVATLQSDVAALSSTPGDIIAVGLRVTSLENDAITQDADITTNTTDIANLINWTDYGSTTLTTTAQTLAQAINEHDAEIGSVAMTTTATNIRAAINEVDADTATNASDISALTARVATLEGLVNDLIARVGGGSTAFALDDLSDVATAGATNGQQLTYNGSGWSAANA